MKTLAVTIACALCAIACSPSASDDGPSIQQESGSDSGGLDEYAGKPFSEFVADHPDYLISRRAVSSEAVGLFSESDGIDQQRYCGRPNEYSHACCQSLGGKDDSCRGRPARRRLIRRRTMQIGDLPLGSAQ